MKVMDTGSRSINSSCLDGDSTNFIFLFFVSYHFFSSVSEILCSFVKIV